MVKRRHKTKALYPRSFLASADLDMILDREARRRTMTKSQLIRHAITEWLVYQGVKNADKLNHVEGDEE